MTEKPEGAEARIDQIVERSVQRAVFGGRRDFLAQTPALVRALQRTPPIPTTSRQRRKTTWPPNR